MAEDGDFEEDLIKKVILDVIEADCQPEKNLNVTQFKEFTHTIIDDLYRELHKLKKMFNHRDRHWMLSPGSRPRPARW